MNYARYTTLFFGAVSPLLITGCDAARSSDISSSDFSIVEGESNPLPTVLEGVDDQENEFEKFNSNNFDRSTAIDNQWFPLKPGTRYVWEGTSIDDEGDEESHVVVLTVTDLTKVVGGVRTVVCWDRDYVDGELVEAEIVFFAQDNDGAVWHFGQYPEEYEDGQLIASPGWLHGVKDGRAGIHMPAHPKLGDPSFSQGWAPSVPWTDRGVVHEVGQKVKVPYGTFQDVLVIDEYNREEPNAHQYKYYASGVGNIKVGWHGDEQAQENLELTKVEQLSAGELALAGNEARRLERNAAERCHDVFARAEPAQEASIPSD